MRIDNRSVENFQIDKNGFFDKKYVDSVRISSTKSETLYLIVERIHITKRKKQVVAV